MYRVLKSAGKLLIANSLTPESFIIRIIIKILEKHHSNKFGLENLIPMIENSGYKN